MADGGDGTKLPPAGSLVRWSAGPPPRCSAIEVDLMWQSRLLQQCASRDAEHSAGADLATFV